MAVSAAERGPIAQRCDAMSHHPSITPRSVTQRVDSAVAADPIRPDHSPAMYHAERTTRSPAISKYR